MNSSFNSLLVPVDFSDPSREAFRRAQNLLDRDDPTMIVLHVIDQAVIDLLTASELVDEEELTSSLRARRERELQEFIDLESADIDLKGIVSIGHPFLEIIRKADDFAVDAIVMGKAGSGSGVERLLFGSTAERVLRGSMRPVLVFPSSARSP